MARVTPGTPDWGDDLNTDLNGIELLAQQAFDKVRTVPAGTPGWSSEPDGTLWVEYNP